MDPIIGPIITVAILGIVWQSSNSVSSAPSFERRQASAYHWSLSAALSAPAATRTQCGNNLSAMS